MRDTERLQPIPWGPDAELECGDCKRVTRHVQRPGGKIWLCMVCGCTRTAEGKPLPKPRRKWSADDIWGK